jgi:hypothetical protein
VRAANSRAPAGGRGAVAIVLISARTDGSAPGDFPRAEAFHAGAIKLPVWHREEDIPLAGQYIEGFRKVAARYRDLLA